MEVAKRDGILSAAAKAFQRFGFKKASIDAIAEAAGVAKGTVYLAAQSKEDLFYQVLHREVRSWAASVAKNLDPRLPADELLAYASDAGVRYFDDHPLVRSLLFGECHLMLPKWKDRLDDLATIGRENVVDILRLGQKQGLFREDLDLDTVAVLLIDLQISYFLLHDHNKEARAERMKKRRAAGLDLVLNGLKKPGPHHPA